MMMCSSDEDLVDDYCRSRERNDRNYLLDDVPNNKRPKITQNCRQDGIHNRLPSEFVPSTSAGLWPWGKSNTNQCNSDISCDQLRRMTFIKNCDNWQTPAPSEKTLSKLACVTVNLIWEIEEAKRFCARFAMKTKRSKCKCVQFNFLSSLEEDESDNNSVLSSCWDDDDVSLFDDDSPEVCHSRKWQSISLERGGNTVINRNLMKNQNENYISSSSNNVNNIRNFRTNVDQSPHYTSPANAAEHLLFNVNDVTIKRQANKIKKRKKKSLSKVKKLRKRLKKK